MWEDNKTTSTRESNQIMYSQRTCFCIYEQMQKKEERHNINMNTQRPPSIRHTKKKEKRKCALDLFILWSFCATTVLFVFSFTPLLPTLSLSLSLSLS